MNKLYHEVPKIYVAGKLNDMACDYIKNMHTMIQTAEKVRKSGFAVFVPGIDFLQALVFGNWEYNDYFDNSQPWLLASDGVFLCDNWEESKGTQREIELAKEYEIPVFYGDLKELKDYFDGSK